MSKTTFVLFAAMLAAGCADAPKPPPKAPVVPETTRAEVPQSKEAPRAVAVSDDLAKACQIHFSNLDKAPKFDFDKDDLMPQDRDVLDQVAKCVTTGPLKGRSLKLVGRADARGETEYNMSLGGRRAASVKGYLGRLGVDGSKLVETSRGELDANGADEQGWARDRRVDLDLAP